jgi:cytochrome c
MNPIPVPRDIPLPLPAAEPVLVGVLVVFFLLHIVFVNFMVGGLLLTLWHQIRGLRAPRHDALAHAIAGTVTANKSIAVVLGVGPLLAINTLYTVYFYTANALTGAFWIGVVPLVIVAFVLTYLHKYLWDRMAGVRGLHIALCATACLLFLFIPLVFLANVNLMLQPGQWTVVQGFLSVVLLPNVLPRYLHFVLACPAMTGLFLVWLFRRARAEDLPRGFSRAELMRIGYHWALWPTAAQFLVGPLVLFTLPAIQQPLGGVLGVFAASFLAALPMAWLMFLETRRPAAEIGRSFVAVCALMVIVVGMMGMGRHAYREAAVAPHRALVQARTEDYLREVEAARRAADAPAAPQRPGTAARP